ncbi:DUF6682 family protein [uncultured Gilvimarinus sp.]|uniref:phage adaptor protein n=1 Tax=uncultured Gilvimarinus sp. TaxID=1689143 RepID=UPI0030EF8B6D|tara:strand:+ start:553 stop:1218 length:666 start_codon:yes stop_codon:yes gene_type:complete
MSSVEAITNTIVTALRDADQDNWPEAYIHKAIHEAECVIVNYRPDAYSVNATFDCAEGIEQDISSVSSPAPHRLLSVKYNVVSGSPGRSIRRVSVGDLDGISPDWRSKTAGAAIREFMFDEREPLLFYVNPPAANGAAVQISYSGIPAEYGNVTGSTQTSVNDTYEPMIIEWALYRLFGQDVEGSVNINRSQAHLNNFGSMMGIKLQGEQVTSVKEPGFRL